MNDMPPEIEARRTIENAVAKLGRERQDLDRRLSINAREIATVIPVASAAGITFEEIAQLIGVSRQTLYRWREE